MSHLSDATLCFIQHWHNARGEPLPVDVWIELSNRGLMP